MMKDGMDCRDSQILLCPDIYCNKRMMCVVWRRCLWILHRGRAPPST